MEHNRLQSRHQLDPVTHFSISEHVCTKPVPVHLHEYYELEFILEGTGTQNLNGAEYPISPGTIYFLTPIDFHAIIPESRIKTANISFDATLLPAQLPQLFMNRRDNCIFDADDAGCQTMRSLFSLLLAEQHTTDDYAYRARSMLLELLLIQMARLRSSHAAQLSGEAGSQLQKAMQYLFCHFREDIRLAEVAACSGYTPNHFCKLFHDQCGQRFVDFLNQLRLNYAKMLLLSTQFSMAEIAEKSGFGSLASFYRCFRQQHSIAPTAYRDHHSIH